MLPSMHFSGRPTYQDALRAVGRYFDQHSYRQVLVTEVDDGFVARAFFNQTAIRKPMGIALPISDILDLIANQERAREMPVTTMPLPAGFPTGYEDCFRSLGYELDGAAASTVSLAELNSGLLVCYALHEGGRRRPAQMYYDTLGLDELLARGRGRRGAILHTPEEATARR